MTAKLTQVTQVALEEFDKYRVTPARFNIHTRWRSAPRPSGTTGPTSTRSSPVRRCGRAVERDHDKPYHLRFRSGGPVQAAILNDAPGAEPDSQHGFTLDGTRYAALHAPRREDVIVIKNEGAAPIQVSGLTEHPAAISHKVEGPGRLAPGVDGHPCRRGQRAGRNRVPSHPGSPAPPG
jgi:hypothetical protein